MERFFFLVLLSILVAGFFTIGPAQADLISPAITHVYFEKDGTPYNGSVQYSVNCYGYDNPYPPVLKTPGSYQPELVYHYSASCGEYGCSIYEPYYFRYTHIDWCDLEGTADKSAFVIRNFSSKPYTRCDSVWERVEKQRGNKREYYYYTPEYSLCKKVAQNLNESVNVYQISYSETPGSPNRTSVLILPNLKPLYRTPGYNSTTIPKSDNPRTIGDYISYLETCDPVTDPRCPGWIVNGKSLKSYPGLRPLQDNATTLMENPCDRFLISADPSLIMPFTERDPWHHACADDCNYTYEICESRFTIPAEGKTTISSVDSSPTTDAGTSTVALSQELSESRPVSVSRSRVESLYCSIIELLGGRCE